MCKILTDKSALSSATAPASPASQCAPSQTSYWPRRGLWSGVKPSAPHTVPLMPAVSNTGIRFTAPRMCLLNTIQSSSYWLNSKSCGTWKLSHTEMTYLTPTQANKSHIAAGMSSQGAREIWDKYFASNWQMWVVSLQNGLLLMKFRIIAFLDTNTHTHKHMHTTMYQLWQATEQTLVLHCFSTNMGQCCNEGNLVKQYSGQTDWR